MSFQVKLAARYLMGRKLRTALTTLSIFLGVMLIFGMNGALPAVMKSYRQNMMSSVGRADLTITSDARGFFSERAVKTVRETPGIGSAIGKLSRKIILPPDRALKARDGSKINGLDVEGMEPDDAAIRQLSIIGGRGLKTGDDRSAVIPDELSKKTGIAVGDVIYLPSSSGLTGFRIAGIARGAPGFQGVYITLEAAQELFDQPGRINSIEVVYGERADGEAVRKAVLERLGRGFKVGGNEAGSEFEASIKVGEIALNMFGLLSLAMGGFIIFNTFRTSVVERRRDIGMLRSLGASRASIIGLVVAESLLQGAAGTFAGLIGGYALVVGFLGALEPVWQKMLHFSVGVPSFTAQNYALAIGLGLGVSLISGLYPAMMAARISPLEAMRPPAGESFWKGSGWRAAVGGSLIAGSIIGLASGQYRLVSSGALLFVVGLILLSPALIHPIAAVFGRVLALVFSREGRIAEGNLERNPGRAAVTASTIMIGLAVVLALAGVFTSLLSGVNRYLDKSLGADYLLMPQSLVLGGGNVGASPSLLEELKRIKGVAAATSLRQSPSRSDGTDIQVIGVDPSTYPKVAGLEFSVGNPDLAYESLEKGRTLIANGILAAQKGLKTGQKLILETPEGPRTYRVVAIGSDYLNVKLATAYISHKNLAADFHERTDLLYMVNREPNANPAAVRSALDAAIKGYPTFTLYDSASWRASIKEQTNSVMGIYYALMGILVVPSLIALINTLGISVLERVREIGVLRAIGATRRQVKRMVLAESLLLASAGTGFGILAGLWFGYVMVAGMQVSGFKMPYYFPYAGILVTVAIGLLFGVLGSIIPARQAAKLDIVGALHYE